MSAPTVTLEVISANGNINLTQFLDVEEGKGMEPGDPKFTEKVWARSLLKTGATLALETLREKEQIYPLKLHASSKQALTNLVQELNTIINTPGAQVKWQDEGATVPTYFTLLSGQFDDEYDFRLGQNNWLKGRLRLFTQPLGYATQNGPRSVMVSGVATTTRVGTSPVVTFTPSGAYDGDADGLLQIQISSATSTPELFAAVSVLPSPEYIPFIPVASLAFSGASFLHDVNAPNGTAAHMNAGSLRTGAWQPPETSRLAYAGIQRVLLAVRTPSLSTPQPVQLSVENNERSITVATPVATSSWQMMDMGIITTPSQALYYGPKAYELLVAPLATGSPSPAIDIGGLVQLPDESTCFLHRTESSAMQPPLIFDGVGNTVISHASMGVPASGVPVAGEFAAFFTGYVRGALPRAPAAATPPTIAALMVNGGKNGSFNLETRVNVNVLEQTRYAF